jgi:hypothetical protein
MSGLVFASSISEILVLGRIDVSCRGSGTGGFCRANWSDVSRRVGSTSGWCRVDSGRVRKDNRSGRASEGTDDRGGWSCVGRAGVGTDGRDGGSRAGVGRAGVGRAGEGTNGRDGGNRDGWSNRAGVDRPGVGTDGRGFRASVRTDGRSDRAGVGRNSVVGVLGIAFVLDVSVVFVAVSRVSHDLNTTIGK